MTLEQDRLDWKLSLEQQTKVNDYIQRIVDVMLEEEVKTIAVIGVDKVYRNYMEWLYSARDQRVDAELARNATVHIISTMIVEIASQMAGRTLEDGKVMALDTWLSDFMYDLRDELLSDLQMMKESGTSQ